ncbi:queuosine salvage family protein [Thalassospira xiamenensis]|uniref:Potential Queuosine, Q, salvage protein family n=1 Tax=Thalassospira xiamenensis TaxID=220697 RepID=A0A285TI21_9PROT|nr:queuosine salvage family protein [Thalassospira xiamenensis]SOC21712.1 Potential Queuosine, Q, salvage protein family [Thalassospira xiamenensis]
MFTENLESLRAARTSASLYEACIDIMAHSPYVEYQKDNLGALVDMVRETTVPDVSHEVRHPGPVDACFDIVFNSAMNGGYFYKAPETQGDDVIQWQINGSGSQAMYSWLDRLNQEGLIPSFGCHELTDELRLRIDEHLCGVPYAVERRTIFEEFFDRDAQYRFRQLMQNIVGEAFLLKSCNFSWDTVCAIADIFPQSFKLDPFKKKACLSVLLLTCYLNRLGYQVQTDIIIPSDYQIPRILAFRGVLQLSDGFERALKSGRLLEPKCDAVMHFRAAAIVACRDLAKLSNVPDWLVDQALFNTFRVNDDFREKALPPMKISGIWF